MEQMSLMIFTKTHLPGMPLPAGKSAGAPAQRAVAAGAGGAMRVFFYVRDFIAQHERPGGGLYKAVAGLAAGMVNAGQPVEILCEGSSDLHETMPAGYTVRCFKNDETKSVSFTLAAGLKQYISSLPRPSLFALNGIFVPGNIAVAKLLRSLRQPYIVAPHDPFHPTIFAKGWLKKTIYWHLFERPMLRNATAVQLLDARHEQYLRENGIETPTFGLPNGYVPQDVLPESSLTFRTKPEQGPMRFYFLGRVDAHNKGLDLLIDAFASLRKSAGAGFDAELTIQGPDWGDSHVLADQAAGLGVSDRVKVLPPDFNATSAKLIASHDVLCMPSRFEGFGLAAMEAMLNGRMVLVSEIAGLAPYVAEVGAGVVVQPTVESIRAGLQTLAAKRSQWEQIGLATRQFALDRFRWETICTDCLQQYRRFLSLHAQQAGLASAAVA
jgi:glycosyltransferase involved in cell wall biosynthesis